MWNAYNNPVKAMTYAKKVRGLDGNMGPEFLNVHCREGTKVIWEKLRPGAWWGEINPEDNFGKKNAEVLAFHGTNPKNIANILENGFLS